MKQYPLFVPTGGGHVAAVATVPDGEPKGLVVLLAGTVRHNLIGSTMSAYLSDRLARLGLASVRLDYEGIGDSTGAVQSWTPADTEAASSQARRVLDEVSEALGVDRFASLGMCYGSRVALDLVDHPACVGAVCLAPPILDHSNVSKLSRRLGVKPGLAFVRSNPLLRRLVVVPLRRLLRPRRAGRRVAGAFAHLDRARLFFVYGDHAMEDHYSLQAQRSVEARVSTLPAEQQQRFTLEMLPTGPLTAFEGLRHDEQERIVELVLPYVERCFADAPETGAEAIQTAATAPHGARTGPSATAA